MVKNYPPKNGHDAQFLFGMPFAQCGAFFQSVAARKIAGQKREVVLTYSPTVIQMSTQAIKNK